MTDRTRYLTVILDQEYRSDDVQAFVQAISMINGVDKVELGEAVGGNDYINRQVVGMEMYTKIVAAAREIVFPKS